MKNRLIAVSLLALMLCSTLIQAFASDDRMFEVDPIPIEDNDVSAESVTPPYGWNGATDVDYNKEDATPIQGDDEPSEIVSYASASGTWIKSSNGKWWYKHTDGTYTTSGWEYIDGYWYYFDADGWMVTGWQKVNGKWYYLSSSGAMVTGWKKINGSWYYFNSGGVMLSNTSFSAPAYDKNGNVAGTYVYCLGSSGALAYTISRWNSDLYDSSGYLDYAVKYGEYVYYTDRAASIWNAYKSGVIRKSESGVDVYVQDIYDSSDDSNPGLTYPRDRLITLNRFYLDNYTPNQKQNTILHEMGHALGLYHNELDDVMYKKVTSNITLTTNDKKSYDYAYKTR